MKKNPETCRHMWRRTTQGGVLASVIVFATPPFGMAQDMVDPQLSNAVSNLEEALKRLEFDHKRISGVEYLEQAETGTKIELCTLQGGMVSATLPRISFKFSKSTTIEFDPSGLGQQLEGGLGVDVSLGALLEGYTDQYGMLWMCINLTPWIIYHSYVPYGDPAPFDSYGSGASNSSYDVLRSTPESHRNFSGDDLLGEVDAEVLTFLETAAIVLFGNVEDPFMELEETPWFQAMNRRSEVLFDPVQAQLQASISGLESAISTLRSQDIVATDPNVLLDLAVNLGTQFLPFAPKVDTFVSAMRGFTIEDLSPCAIAEHPLFEDSRLPEVIKSMAVGACNVSSSDIPLDYTALQEIYTSYLDFVSAVERLEDVADVLEDLQDTAHSVIAIQETWRASVHNIKNKMNDFVQFGRNKIPFFK